MRLFVIVFLLVFTFVPATAGELQRLNLDDASTIGTTIQTDTGVKTEGIGSVRIATKHPTTICIGEIAGLDVENATLIYQAKVKSDLVGAAFLEMWAHVGGGQYFSRGLNDPIQGTSDWRTLQAPFLFQKGQNPDKIILNIVINGSGTVWVDDVVLSKAPLD